MNAEIMKLWFVEKWNPLADGRVLPEAWRGHVVFVEPDLWGPGSPRFITNETFSLMSRNRETSFVLWTANAEHMRNYHHAVRARSGAAQREFAREFAPLPNVWMGVRADSVTALQYNTVLLMDTPAAVRWLWLDGWDGAIEDDARYIARELMRTHDYQPGSPVWCDWLLIQMLTAPPRVVDGFREIAAHYGIPVMCCGGGAWDGGWPHVFQEPEEPQAVESAEESDGLELL